MGKVYILDANVMIYLAEIGKINALFKSHIIHLSPVVYEEIKFIEENESEFRISINLQEFIDSERLKILDSPNYDMVLNTKREILKSRRNLDDGELEAISFLLENRNFIFCTGDKAAIIILAFLGLAEQGISLERLMGKFKNMQNEYTEKYFRKYIIEGRTLKIQFNLDFKQ
ncbi:hypothetical protein KAU33_10000 [Candidatus Dependentiae bacterium]|nr:hypothetical protein [Candidatus Dependentiae bacterium]